MTLHVFYDHQCPECGFWYIPYDDSVACPKCGLVEEERFDFIPRAAESLQFNLESTGSYVPCAWYTGSLGDHSLSVLFGLFDEFVEEEETDFRAFIENILSEPIEGDEKHFRDHICSIALRIDEAMAKE